MKKPKDVLFSRPCPSVPILLEMTIALAMFDVSKALAVSSKYRKVERA